MTVQTNQFPESRQRTKLLTPLIHLILFMLASGPGLAQESTVSHGDSLNEIVQAYYKRNLSVFQSNSTVAGIDSIFKLYTDDFTYHHPKYGGTYTRSDLYEGYVRNQKNGGYDGRIIDIKIINMISGLNALVVEKRFITRQGDETKEGESEMTLFEFEDGRISKILEYW